jgi:hypothetical protein
VAGWSICAFRGCANSSLSNLASRLHESFLEFLLNTAATRFFPCFHIFLTVSNQRYSRPTLTFNTVCLAFYLLYLFSLAPFMSQLFVEHCKGQRQDFCFQKARLMGGLSLAVLYSSYSGSICYTTSRAH